MAKRMKSGCSKLPAKKRKELVSEVIEEEQEVYEEALEILWNSVQFEEYETRKEFCNTFKEPENSANALKQCKAFTSSCFADFASEKST